MKLMKLIMLSAILLAGSSLFAQKAVSVIVWPETNAVDGENRVASLVWEYFKSELATHSRIAVVAASIADAEKKQPNLAGALTTEKIKTICKDTGAAMLCLPSLSRSQDGKFHVKITIFNADGSKKSEINRDFDAVKESDFIAVVAARDTAIAIRGEDPVDQINRERENLLLKELQRAEEETPDTF